MWKKKTNPNVGYFTLNSFKILLLAKLTFDHGVQLAFNFSSLNYSKQKEPGSMSAGACVQTCLRMCVWFYIPHIFTF